MDMETSVRRKPTGRFGNMVRLNISVMAAQDRQLDVYCQLTGKTKATAIRELLQIGLNMLREDKVI